ncbi:hypothetical protein PHYPSEUDO_012014 [Phytophthora pseudosyringae]|uniref:Uncharacterized protein n=1 Tax=Phytophthora pseudosyringae TaxID=221518 RepID=A0A8T1VAB2_9STRA|nr:hypothetical protein PHYPSEUDO_012014 [Phytophthora pseudosyringae]
MPLAVGKYERYVRAATFLLDWLLRAHEQARPDANDLHLKSLNGVVQRVARDSSCLRPELLRELPKVLKAFHCAIELRELFAAPLLANGKSLFVAFLQIWRNLLQMVPLENRQETATAEWAVEEDGYCPGEEKFVVDTNHPKKLKAERIRLCHEAFADDFGLDVVFFVSDLEQLVRGVHTCYHFVKVQTSTLIEVTVSVKLAMDTASDLTTKLQRRHPEIRTTQDLMDAVYKLALGLIALSRMMILSSLSTYATALPSEGKTEAIFLTNEVERYGEERAPQYMFPDPFKVSAFFMQQLPLIYNSIREQEKVSGSGYDRSKLEGSFLGLMDDFFTLHQVTVPLVFACTCWMKSVLALQGHGGLSRNVALMLRHAMKLSECMEEIDARPSILAVIRDIISTDIQLSRAHFAERMNPVLTGLKVLDLHFDYLRISTASAKPRRRQLINLSGQRERRSQSY